MKNGTKLQPYFLLKIINEDNFYTNYSTLQYQFVQKKLDSFTFYMVVKNAVDKVKIEQFICDFTAIYLQEDVQIYSQYCEQIIPDLKTGKIVAFVLNCKETRNRGEGEKV